MNSRTLVARLSRALEVLFRSDKDLFDLGTDGINEQTLTFRLGLYLSCEFPKHHVDCEYNRLWDNTKRCLRHGINWMKPDVIVHRRQSDKSNLICLEAKKLKDWKDIKSLPEDVERKLVALTDPGEAYRYSLGFAWRISPIPDRAEHDVVWFIAGKPVATTTLENFEPRIIALLDETEVLN